MNLTISSPHLSDLRGRTKLLVLQGTPFCNIACDYCYLPDRNSRVRMPLTTIGAAVRWIFANALAADHLTLIWHAGEPLTLPQAWYDSAFAAAKAAASPEWIPRHAVQTNGMLIDDEWCSLFARHSIRVGVSLDGPAELHDLRRRMRNGRGTHAATMRGIAALKRNRIPFHVICVVTEAALSHSDAIMDFFAAQDILDVGFNIEEIEGENLSSTLTGDDAVRSRFRAFFERVVDRTAAFGIRVREVRNVLGALVDVPDKTWRGNDQNMPFAIVTVTHDGALHTFSPELAGTSHARYGSMVLGNVGTDSLADVLGGDRFQSMWAEISAGIDACERTCAYFPLCRGGAPSNKLAELGTFAGTETMACRLCNQEVSEVILHRILSEMKRDSIVAEAS